MVRNYKPKTEGGEWMGHLWCVLSIRSEERAVDQKCCRGLERKPNHLWSICEEGQSRTSPARQDGFMFSCQILTLRSERHCRDRDASHRQHFSVLSSFVLFLAPALCWQIHILGDPQWRCVCRGPTWAPSGHVCCVCGSNPFWSWALLIGYSQVFFVCSLHEVKLYADDTELLNPVNHSH